MVQSINSNSVFGTQTARAAAVSSSAQANVADNTAKTSTDKKQDVFVKDEASKENAGIYEKPKKITTEELKSINAQQLSSFNKMLSDMLGTQVNNVSKALFDHINVSAEDKAKAQKAIADGGEYSVEAVSTRILDMAKSLSGGDASKFEMLKNAVKKGFGEAGKQWGAELPEITTKTYDKVMQGFDDWEKE
ncbi:MAG: hypothetical protein RR654_07100, partial [Oscillospiraceae bacterium]